MIDRAAKLLAPDWLSAQFLHLVGFLKQRDFEQKFQIQRSLVSLEFEFSELFDEKIMETGR